MSGFCLCITMDPFKQGDIGMLPNFLGQVCSLPQPDSIFRWSLGLHKLPAFYPHFAEKETWIAWNKYIRSWPSFTHVFLLQPVVFCENRSKSFHLTVFKTWPLFSPFQDQGWVQPLRSQGLVNEKRLNSGIKDSSAWDINCTSLPIVPCSSQLICFCCYSHFDGRINVK